MEFVSRWQLLGAVSVALLVAWVLVLQTIQGALKPLVILIQTTRDSDRGRKSARPIRGTVREHPGRKRLGEDDDVAGSVFCIELDIYQP